MSESTVPVETVTYAELQEQAKALGIPANQKREDLEAAIAAAQPAGPATEAGQALAGAVDFDVTFAATGEKSSEGDGTTAADLEAAAEAKAEQAAKEEADIAAAEEVEDAPVAVLAEREAPEGTYRVLSDGTKWLIDADGHATQLAGPGFMPDHDQPSENGKPGYRLGQGNPDPSRVE